MNSKKISSFQTATQLAEINTRRFSTMCHLAKKWREIANNEFIKSIELGADGMLYDENQHHGGARYCFDSHYGHHVPAHIFAGDGNYDLEFRHYHLSYFCVDLDHVPIHRYVAPDEEMMEKVKPDTLIVATAVVTLVCKTKFSEILIWPIPWGTLPELVTA